MTDMPMNLATDSAPASTVSYEKLAVKRLANCIVEIRKHQAELQAQTIHVLLEVAIQPGLNMSELMRKTGLSQASCSRNVMLLSDRDRHDKPGLGLVRSELDPIDNRRKIVRLTPKGETLVSQLADLVR
jgi:DNA-binding MarR family transcriptional regulator